MSTTTLGQARDLIGEVIADAAEALIPKPKVYWDDVHTDDTPPPGCPHVIVGIEPVGGGQTSIGEPGGGRFRRTGVVMLRVMTPMGDGAQMSSRFCQAFLDALEGQHVGSVWFRNVRCVHRGRVEQFHEQRVVADYQYDDNK